jgi:hypothetical protein
MRTAWSGNAGCASRVNPEGSIAFREVGASAWFKALPGLRSYDRPDAANATRRLSLADRTVLWRRIGARNGGKDGDYEGRERDLFHPQWSPSIAPTTHKSSGIALPSTPRCMLEVDDTHQLQRDRNRGRSKAAATAGCGLHESRDGHDRHLSHHNTTQEPARPLVRVFRRTYVERLVQNSEERLRVLAVRNRNEQLSRTSGLAPSPPLRLPLHHASKPGPSICCLSP